jgi:hypothetical protein
MGFVLLSLEGLDLVGMEVKEGCGCFLQDGRFEPTKAKRCPHVENPMVAQQVRMHAVGDIMMSAGQWQVYITRVYRCWSCPLLQVRSTITGRIRLPQLS